MGGFRKGGGGGRSFGSHGGGYNRGGSGGGYGGGRSRGPVVMFQAVCAECGKKCEVPFEPTEGRPVYCNACFGGKKESESTRSGNGFPQKSYDTYSAPAAPDSRIGFVKRNDDELKKQLELLNLKMDRLIQVVESMANAKSLVVKEKVKKVAKTSLIAKTKKSAKKKSSK